MSDKTLKIMSFQTFVTNKLTEITNWMNAVSANSKKIDEFTEQSTLAPLSKIHVSNDGDSESVTIQQIIDAAVNNQNNQILSIGELTLVDNDLTVPSGISWKINNVVYSKAVDTVITIPYCDTGLNRKDIIIADDNGDVLRISGLETIGIVVAPPLPLNTLLITEVDVTDSTIGDPSEPVVGISPFKGYWNADTNTPALVNGVGRAGDYLITSVPGENFSYTFGERDRIEYNGSIWYKSVDNNQATDLSDYYNKTETDDLLDAKLDASAYNDRFKGKYTSLANLQSAHATANDGDYAIVDAGSGTDALEYIWDTDEGWLKGNSTGASTTDGLTEGSTNLYFTTARVLAAVLTGISFATGGAIVSTDTVLQAFGKIQKQINDLSTVYQSILTDVNFGSFVSGQTAKTTPIDADSFSIVDSADSNKAKELTLLNLRTYLNSYFASKFRIGSATNTSTVTGTTTLTLVSGPTLIPANTFVTGDAFTFRARLKRTVPTSSNSVAYFYVSASASVTDISDSSLRQIASYAVSLTNTLVQGKSEVVIKNASNATELVQYTNSDDDIMGSDYRLRTDVDWTVDQYVYLFIWNAQTTTSSFISFWELFKK